MSKFLSRIMIILTALILLPFASLAQEADEQSTIKIIVTDENDNPFSGNWYLHQGTTKKGRIIRNGSAGETFTKDPGNYYLEANRKSSRYPLVWLKSENPQTLKAGETITYELQYFKTQEDMDAAKNDTTIPAPVIAPAPTPEPKKTIAPAPEPKKSTPIPVPKRTISINPNSYKAVPDFNSAPTTPTPTSAAASTTPVVMELAETGNPALALLVISGIIGGLISRKKW